MFKDLREFIKKLEEERELIHIKGRLSPKFEIPGVIKYFVKERNSVLFFDNVEGYKIPVVANLLGTKRRLALAMGVKEKNLAEEYLSRRKKPIKPTLVKRGPVKENIISEKIDIIKAIPVLTHHEKDAGPYFTTGVVISKDTKTGIRSMGIHRVQIKGPHTLGIFLNMPPVATFLERAEKRGEPLEIAIVLGLDPVSFFSSVILAPEGIDKFDIAGGLIGRSVSLVKCESVDLEVPANAEFVLEGRVLPGKREPEGPFGESSGHYFTFNNPVAEIEVITHRNEPIYHALMPFAGEEDILMDFCWQMEGKSLLLNSIPGLEDIVLKDMGLITVAQIKKQEESDGLKIIEQLFECGIPNKVIIAVDEDVDIYDDKDLWWAISTRFQPDRDVVIKKDMPGLSIDPSNIQTESDSSGAKVLVTMTSKIGIDATKPLKDYDRYKRLDVPELVKSRIRPIIERYLAVKTP
ncbi:MAG TPA: UbiD family decarboxylase [Deltaproteobacteria bacterium]|nr:UbiD family decarboxylase [Deltaproteobacteria bacterium]